MVKVWTIRHARLRDQVRSVSTERARQPPQPINAHLQKLLYTTLESNLGIFAIDVEVESTAI
jgi:hypothetical protein